VFYSRSYSTGHASCDESLKVLLFHRGGTRSAANIGAE
jgi:hypothetical protein